MKAPLLVLTFLCACLLTGLFRRHALRRNLLDLPNARSSHAVPTPRGGGVAVVIAFAMASLVLMAAGSVAAVDLGAVLGGGLMVAVVGFADDLGHVPFPGRLAVHLGASVFALVLLGGPPPSLAGGGWLGWGLALLGIVWGVNLYNFMDGIDGLAALEAVTVGGGAALLLFQGGEAALAWWLLALACASGGFLVWNLAPARIFLGDSGSGFLGFVLALLALVTVRGGALSPWIWAILVAVFVTDASFTLGRRICRGERFWQAHRSHAYQHLARRFGHGPVTAAVGAVNLCWLLPLAFAAAHLPRWAPLLALLAYTPLLFLAVLARAGAKG